MGHDTEIWLENRRGGITLGIDEAAPRISFISPDRGPYGLRLTREDGSVQTQRTSSSRLVAWPFAHLAPRERAMLQVGVEDNWSSPVAIERGLVGDWQVDFVSPSPQAPTGMTRPAHLLRAEFDLAALGMAVSDISEARVYATAHGLYELELNAARVGDDALAPGWTSYRHRLRYQTHDVTTGLRDGVNVVGAWLADGWYRGNIGFDGGVWDNYGTDVSLLLQLELTRAGGERMIVPLHWRSSASPITSAGLYEGESFDARLVQEGWSSPGFDDSRWEYAAALPVADFTAAIEAPTALPVRGIEILSPVRTERLEGGRIRLDFGQNISGVLRIRPRAERGHVIRLHHAEVLENGELGIRPLRRATSVDTYTCSGTAGEEYTPRFTIHGFQYAELEGWVGELEPDDVQAVVTHTDMQRTGWFACSDENLNRLHSNVVWSMRDNFVDLPTDCPQRDERVGWTGDLQVFAPTALRLYAAHGTLTGWLRDLAAEQWNNGHVPQFVPWVTCGFPNLPTAAWGDAAVIVPWSMYLNDGDTRILADQYDSMRAWVDLVDELTGHTGLWNDGFQLGDWLDPSAPPDNPGSSHTDRYLVATAYHVRTARILADTAALLGAVEDHARYRTIAARATAAFQDEFISPSGRIVSDTVTSIALAIVFDLLRDDDEVTHAGRRLLHLVAHNDFHISTGFVGTPIICDALVKAGSPDYAYHLLMQPSMPSWLYPVTMGATTIWERWDSMLPDGSINTGDMTSFNHYALGAVADFLHRGVAGMTPMAPGWTRIRFQPLVGGSLTSAEATYDSVRGTARSSWRRDDSTFALDITVPVGATALVILPTGEEHEVGSGGHHFTCAVRPAAEDPGAPVFGSRAGAAQG